MVGNLQQVLFNGKLYIWEVQSFTIIGEINGVKGCHAIAYSPDNTTLAVETRVDNHHNILLVDTSTGRKINIISYDGFQFPHLAFNPTMNYLAGSTEAGNVHIWDTSPGSPSFGKCIKVIDFNTDCRGMKISGARGLDQKKEWWQNRRKYEGTFFDSKQLTISHSGQG